MTRKLQLPVPEFALRKRKHVIEQLLQEPDIAGWIDATAAGDENKKRQLLNRARRYARAMGPKFSSFFYFRIGYFLARTLIRLYFKVRLVRFDEQAFAEIPPGTTLVLASNHRSNFDPLIIAYLSSQRSTLSLSAGEWARMWPFYHLVQLAGGFVIERKADDPLYMKVLAAYIRLTAANGVHHAFFPEGVLSQDGRMSKPKLGFMGFFCRACSRDRDIAFVPVGINYDRIPEDRKLARADGNFDNPRFSFLILSTLQTVWTVLTLPFRPYSRRYGNACVSFGKPVYLRQWLKGQDIGIESLRQPQRYAWLPDFADTVMQRSAAQIPATPVALICSVLCGEPEKTHWSKTELQQALQKRIETVKNNGAGVCIGEGAEDALDTAVSLLVHNKLLSRAGDDMYSIVHEEWPVIEHYANSIESFVK